MRHARCSQSYLESNAAPAHKSTSTHVKQRHNDAGGKDFLNTTARVCFATLLSTTTLPLPVTPTAAGDLGHALTMAQDMGDTETIQARFFCKRAETRQK